MRFGSLLLTACHALDGGVLRTDQHRDVTTCDELQTAVAEALPYHFSPGTRWIIHLAEGEGLSCETSLRAAHPQPEVLELRGPSSPNPPLNLWFSQAGDGVIVDGGHLAFLDGVALIGSGERTQPDVGLHARDHASVRLGPNVAIRGFPIGIKADQSVVHADAHAPIRAGLPARALRIEKATHAGILATRGAAVEAPWACLRDTGSCSAASCDQVAACDLRDTGHGLIAERGSVAHIAQANISCFSGHGVLASQGAAIDADALQVTHNGCDGLHLAQRAYLTGARLIVQHNGRDGVYVADGAVAELMETRVEDHGRVGMYADAGVLITRQGSSLRGNGAEALVADRGGAVLAGTSYVRDEQEGDTFPRDVCAGAASLISIHETAFAGSPYDQPVLNIPPDQLDPTGAALITRHPPFTVLALDPPRPDCYPRAR